MLFFQIVTYCLLSLPSRRSRCPCPIPINEAGYAYHISLSLRKFWDSGTPVLKIQIEEDEGFFFSRQKKERKKKISSVFKINGEKRKIWTLHMVVYSHLSGKKKKKHTFWEMIYYWALSVLFVYTTLIDITIIFSYLSN